MFHITNTIFFIFHIKWILSYWCLLKAICDAVTGSCREDNAVLPPCDPEKNDDGAERWCNNIDTAAEDRKWSSITTVGKAEWPSVLWKISL